MGIIVIIEDAPVSVSFLQRQFFIFRFYDCMEIKKYNDASLMNARERGDKLIVSEGSLLLFLFLFPNEKNSNF